MKPDIVFLDEYSLAGRDLTAVKTLGNYTGYETTTPDQTVARCAGADIVITNKVCIDAAAMEQLPRLHGCEAHCTVMLTAADESMLHRLGVNITCDPVYQSDILFH